MSSARLTDWSVICIIYAGIVYCAKEKRDFWEKFLSPGEAPALPVVRCCRKKGYGVRKRLSGEALWKIYPDVLGWLDC